jgi:hypothetical protein
MNDPIGGVQFVTVSRETFMEFLDTAQNRIIIAKAGYFKAEVEKLISLTNERNIYCKLYVDTEDNAVRFGYGEESALYLINKHIDILNVQNVERIRLSIVIVDEDMLFYSPAALSWEPEPEKLVFPNGFIGHKCVTPEILALIEGGESNTNVEDNSIVNPFEICQILQKNKEDVKQELSKTIDNLKKNPPIDPSILQKTTFYRNNYKLLKITVNGVDIKTKKLSLKLFNNKISKVSENLISSWRVFSPSDTKEMKDIKDFNKKKDSLLREFTCDAKRFGFFINIQLMQKLEDGINAAKEDLIENLKKQRSAEELPNSDNRNSSLADLLEKSRNGLLDHLVSAAERENDIEGFFEMDRTLLRNYKDRKIEKKDALRKVIETFVYDIIKFPKVDELIEKIKVQYDYYDISNELIKNNEFTGLIEEYELKVRDYEAGYTPK